MPPSKVTKQNQTIRQGPVQVADKNGPAWLTLMRNDFPLLRKAIIILGISLISCSAMVIAGKVLWNKQQTAMTLAQAQYNEALNNRNQIASDNQAIHDYQAKYLQLRERGFVGEERRLDWITQIKFIRENRKLLPITYEIAPQQVFQISPEVSTGELELRGSKMKLQIELLHEGDLLNFLDDLKTKGLYTVQDCTLERINTIAETPLSPRLAAECNLYWLTIDKPTGNPDATPQPDNQ